MQGERADVPLHISLTYLDGGNQVKRHLISKGGNWHLAGVATADQLVVLALLGVLTVGSVVLLHQVTAREHTLQSVG